MRNRPFFAEGYRRPDLAELSEKVHGLAARCEAAASEAETIELVAEWNRLRSTVDTNLNVAQVLYHQDTTDADAKAEQDFWNDAAPALRELDVIYARTLLASPHRDAIARNLGDQLLRLKECATATFAPQIAGALAEEARLCTEYVELTARKEVELDGELYTMAGVHQFFGVADRDVRHAAQRAREQFLTRRGGDFDRIFDRLVALRHGMATDLGHDSFTPLGYRLMSRIGYGPDDVARFRDAIKSEVVPLCAELATRQAARLGVDALLFHDEPVRDPAGNARPLGDAAQIVATAHQMYRELHPRLGELMDVMVERDLLDVELRDGKAPGGFCTVFTDLGLPFVFAQMNGTDGDLHVMTHECGHAFQAYAARTLPVIEYAWATCEAAEVHSMSMELLTYPFMERFFGAEADRYRRGHLERAITGLPYVALVDHFQHEVYAAPELSPDQRKQLWLDLEADYLPWRNYGDLFPHLATGIIWQRQMHIYAAPFYYIDYALAQVCALQLLRKTEADRDAALTDYLAICDAGGSVSFLEMLEIGNLESPFDPGTLRGLVAHIRPLLLAD
jgi:M3 family oligoendopeptidase